MLGDARPLGELVREAREREGLSGRAAAARAGLPQPTYAAAEAGRDARRSTLVRLLEALPALDAAEVLGREPRGPTPISARWWAWHAEACGFAAEELTLHVDVDADGSRRTGLAVSGIRPLRGTLDHAPRLSAIAGGVMQGSLIPALKLLRDGLAHGRRHVVEDGAVTHVFDVPADVTAAGFRYERSETVAAGVAPPHGAPYADGCSTWIDVPVARATLQVRFAAEPPAWARPVAWPGSRAVDVAHPVDLFPDLYPHARRSFAAGRGGALELRMTQPLPGLVYGLAFERAAAATAGRGPLVARPAPARPLAEVLREARERHGLSRRETARLLDLSPATLSQLEAGADPRLSTLRSFARSFPDVRTAEILPAVEPDGPMPAAEAWERQVRLHGMVADEEVTDCSISPAGDLRGTFSTRGLRWTGSPRGELRVRHGLVRSTGGARYDLQAVRSRAGTARIRVHARGQEGPVVHDLAIAPAGAGEPVSYQRRVQGRGQFALWRSKAAVPGLAGVLRTWEAVFSEILLPARRLELRLRFPAGYWPPRWTFAVVPRCLMHVEGGDDAGPLLHGEALSVSEDRRRGTLTVEVERPFVGMRYLVAWWLADDR